MYLFAKVFSMKLKDVACIGGWWYDETSENSNIDINNYLSSHLVLWHVKHAG